MGLVIRPPQRQHQPEPIHSPHYLLDIAGLLDCWTSITEQQASDNIKKQGTGKAKQSTKHIINDLTQCHNRYATTQFHVYTEYSVHVYVYV